MSVLFPAIVRSRPARFYAAPAILLGALLAGAAMASPQGRSPTTAPSTEASTTQRRDQDGRDEPRRTGQDRPDRGPDGERGGPGEWPGRGGPPRGWSEPAPEEWEQALAFLRENSPHRLAIYERAEQEWRRQQDAATQPEQLPRSLRGARARIYGRVQLLRMLEERDPPLFTVSLEQFRLEDQIIGHLHAAREAHAAGNEAAAQEAFVKAQEAVGRYATGTLGERESRIQRMREDLLREEQRLQQDRTNLDALVKRLLERFQRSLPGAEREGPREGPGEAPEEPARSDGGGSH